MSLEIESTEEIITSAQNEIESELGKNAKRAQEEKTQIRSPMPTIKEKEHIFSDESLIEKRLLEHYERWLVQIGNSPSKGLSRSFDDKEGCSIISHYVMTLSKGTMDFQNWVENNGLYIEQVKEIHRKVQVKAAILNCISKDAKNKIGSGRYSRGAGRTGSNIMRVLSAEMLSGYQDETGEWRWDIDLFDYWNKMESIVPQAGIYKEVYENFKKGALAEELSGRIMAGIVRDYPDTSVAVTSTQMDARGGYDFSINRGQIVILPVDVRSWGTNAIISCDIKGRYYMDGTPQSVDPNIWEISPNLVALANREHLGFICIRMDIPAILSSKEEWEKFTRNLANVIGVHYVYEQQDEK